MLPMQEGLIICEAAVWAAQVPLKYGSESMH